MNLKLHALILYVLEMTVAFVMCFGKNLTPEESLREDMFLDPVQFLNKYGYEAESFKITTEDGYILEIHHMVQKKNPIIKRKHPVFLMHGLGSSSFDWLSLGTGKSLPHILHNAGFDIWLGNARGNMYSRKHMHIKTENQDFWKFTWHEIGYYDIPTKIDFILQKTSSSKIHYIGHSQGCTVFLVMASMRPEYNHKIQSVNLLAPAVFMSHTNILIMFPALLGDILHKVINQTLGILEFPSPPLITRGPTYYICRKQSSMNNLCAALLFFVDGTDKELLNKTHLPLSYSHVPAGFSMLQLLHYGQLIVNGRFSLYDQGKKRNLQLYASETPPDYPLEKVTAPVALHYGENDQIVSAIDILTLRKKLSNVILYRRIPHPKFNHQDFLFATNVTFYVYDSVVRVIKKYDGRY